MEDEEDGILKNEFDDSNSDSIISAVRKQHLNTKYSGKVAEKGGNYIICDQGISN